MTGKDVERSGCGLFCDAILAFDQRDWRKPQKKKKNSVLDQE